MSEPPAPASQQFDARILREMGRVMFAARWLMAPVYLGLLVTLGLLAIKFVQRLVPAVVGILSMTSNDLILAVLTLVDLSLLANLVAIVIFAGWTNFVAPLLLGPTEQAAATAGELDFSAVKLKLIGSIAGIAAIQILESFVHIADLAKQDVAWELAILLGVGVTGVLLATMDRIAGQK